MNLSEFIAQCENCAETQLKLLFDIIVRNQNCAFGRKYGFANIKTLADFRKNVPITDWEDLEPYSLEASRGVPNQLFSGDPELFIISSGTTGREKILPESSTGLQAKNLTTSLRMEVLRKHFPKITKGKILPLVNKAEFGKTECGIPFGSASGVTLLQAPAALRSITAYPLPVLEIADSAAMDYAIMRFSLMEDVRLIIGNNAGRMEQLVTLAKENSRAIIDDIRNGTLNKEFSISEKIRSSLKPFLLPNPERATQLEMKITSAKNLTPDIYWPNLQVICCWLNGSIGRYVERIRPLFPEQINFMDIGYGATEGKFTIPLEIAEPAGPLAIFGVFFEFASPDQPRKMLLAQELKDGKVYEIFITTHSGLYRYAIHDLVRVEGFTGTTPNLVFETKSTEVVDICGEKTSPTTLINAVSGMVAVTEIKLKNWALVLDIQGRRYNFCIELETTSSTPAAVAAKLAAEIEKQLFGDGILPYPTFRQQKLICPAIVTLMKDGWHEARINTKRKAGDSGNQLKLPLVCPEIPLANYIITSSEVR
jgi:hypothetical protein